MLLRTARFGKTFGLKLAYLRRPMASRIQKIALIGNVAGGKTLLARHLAKIHDLPLTHVDSIQFLPGMRIRPMAETREVLREIEAGEKWLIDGYGPFDLIERRFQAADRVVFVDFPIWRHIWWCSKRQVSQLWSRRLELPEGCDELSWAHTKKLFQSLWQMHIKMRPELLRIFARDNLKFKMIYVRDLSTWSKLAREGLTDPQLRFSDSGSQDS